MKMPDFTYDTPFASGLSFGVRREDAESLIKPPLRVADNVVESAMARLLKAWQDFQADWAANGRPPSSG